MNKRRGFLTTVGSAVAYPALSSRALAERGSVHDVEFEKLTTGIFAELPDGSKDLRDELASLANAIVRNGELIEWRLINEGFSSVGVAEDLLRRTEFVIQILHNHHVGNYLDEAWIASTRSRFKIVTRFLPMVTSYNNLYRSARHLDRIVEHAHSLSVVSDEVFEDFTYSIATFALELGLWTVGTPYKMAWVGTRFISNRTLLRMLHYLDNRLVALLMSEIHWKIREAIYANISANHIEATAEEVTYILGKFDELAQFAVAQSVKTSSGSYLHEVDLAISRSELRRYDFMGPPDSSDGRDGILSWFGFDFGFGL